jgi:hypothetical protein
MSSQTKSEKLDAFWSEHNTKLNTIIGKLSVPAMMGGHPLVKQCHQELIDLAHWVDEQLEAITAE